MEVWRRPFTGMSTGDQCSRSISRSFFSLFGKDLLYLLTKFKSSGKAHDSKLDASSSKHLWFIQPPQLLTLADLPLRQSFKPISIVLIDPELNFTQAARSMEAVDHEIHRKFETEMSMVTDGFSQIHQAISASFPNEYPFTSSASAEATSSGSAIFIFSCQSNIDSVHRKLGFSNLGLAQFEYSIVPYWPIFRGCGPASASTRPRSTLILMLSLNRSFGFLICLFRHNSWIGRGLHLSIVTTSIKKPSDNHSSDFKPGYLSRRCFLSSCCGQERSFHVSYLTSSQIYYKISDHKGLIFSPSACKDRELISISSQWERSLPSSSSPYGERTFPPISLVLRVISWPVVISRIFAIILTNLPSCIEGLSRLEEAMRIAPSRTIISDDCLKPQYAVNAVTAVATLLLTVPCVVRSGFSLASRIFIPSDLRVNALSNCHQFVSLFPSCISALALFLAIWLA